MGIREWKGLFETNEIDPDWGAPPFYPNYPFEQDDQSIDQVIKYYKAHQPGELARTLPLPPTDPLFKYLPPKKHQELIQWAEEYKEQVRKTEEKRKHAYFLKMKQSIASSLGLYHTDILHLSDRDKEYGDSESWSTNYYFAVGFGFLKDYLPPQFDKSKRHWTYADLEKGVYDEMLEQINRDLRGYDGIHDYGGPGQAFSNGPFYHAKFEILGGVPFIIVDVSSSGGLDI
jgi:hypothetical protein